MTTGFFFVRNPHTKHPYIRRSPTRLWGCGAGSATEGEVDVDEEWLTTSSKPGSRLTTTSTSGEVFVASCSSFLHEEEEAEAEEEAEVAEVAALMATAATAAASAVLAQNSLKSRG